ncbi:ferredoxin [Sphaerisporangium perillae]|uniref:ferredoxin n=1 Tax=Sphaerisporangium perillae TaxID=2935860 RepID=UPI00201078AD|nr:ferredoxin [Sphaerisporangium perillae]
MTVRPDDRLLDGAPMQPLCCRQCGAEVEVRKASWHQTSVQWNAEAVSACLERRASSLGDGSGVFPGCTALRDSIARAALEGVIAVPES